MSQAPETNIESIMQIAYSYEAPPLPELPEGAVNLHPDGGNYIYPDNFAIPNFCNGCPLAEGLKRPQIVRVRGLYPVNNRGIKHIGPFAAHVAKALILNDADEPDFDPVFLGGTDIVDPFSAQHESPESRALGRAHSLVNRCQEPSINWRWFRSIGMSCMSGLIRAADYSYAGGEYQAYELRVDPASLRDPSNIIVPRGMVNVARKVDAE